MTYPTEPVFPREVFRELARPLQHPEALCWDPLTERIYCGGEGGQIYAVTLDGIDHRGREHRRQRARDGGRCLRPRLRL